MSKSNAGIELAKTEDVVIGIKKQKSNVDVLRKTTDPRLLEYVCYNFNCTSNNFLYSNADLRLAEHVEAKKKAGVGADPDKINAKREKSAARIAAEKKEVETQEIQSNEAYVSAPVENDDFKFNNEGLTTAEAEELLKKYGKNELPEVVIPKW